MFRVLVAGGTGFLGGEIVEALVQGQFDVGVLSRSRPRDTRVSWIQGDVTRPVELGEKLRGWDVVIDAVQFPNYPMEDPGKGYTFERVDLGGTKNLADAAKAAHVDHFIGLSGVGAAPNAKYHWLRFKWQEEQHIAQAGIRYTIFRPTWVYGARDVSLNRFLGFARFLPFVPIVGNGKTRIAPVFVKDLAAHVRAAVEKGPQDAVFELGGPDTLTMDEIVKTALKVSGKRRFLLHQPVWLMKMVASVAQHFPGRPLTPDAMHFVTQDGLADTTTLDATFGLRRTPLEEGLRTYLSR